MRWRNNRINIETGSWPNLDYQLNTINWHPGKPLFNSINKINKFHLYQHHGVYQIRKHNNHQRHMTCKFHINIDSHCQRIWIQGFKRKYHHSNQYSVSVFESLAIIKDITRHDKPIRRSHTYTDSLLSNNILTSVSYTAFRTHYVPLCEVSIKWGRLREGTNENVTILKLHMKQQLWTNIS